MKVFVGIYSHKHGNDIAVYATRERAEQGRQVIADIWWEHEFDEEEKPTDPEELASAYFDRVEGESFDIEECEVIK